MNATRISIAHPTKRAALPLSPATSKPRQQTGQQTGQQGGQSMTEYQREAQRADALKHERAYYLHVVLPLALDGFPVAQPQYRNLIPGRRFVYDWAYVEARLVVEIQGQIWRKGGHTTGYGVTRDATKLNEATAIGWRVLQFTPEMIASGEARDYTERALRAAGYRTMTAPQTPQTTGRGAR